MTYPLCIMTHLQTRIRPIIPLYALPTKIERSQVASTACFILALFGIQRLVYSALPAFVIIDPSTQQICVR